MQREAQAEAGQCITTPGIDDVTSPVAVGEGLLLPPPIALLHAAHVMQHHVPLGLVYADDLGHIPCRCQVQMTQQGSTAPRSVDDNFMLEKP